MVQEYVKKNYEYYYDNLANVACHFIAIRIMKQR